MKNNLFLQLYLVEDFYNVGSEPDRSPPPLADSFAPNIESTI